MNGLAGWMDGWMDWLDRTMRRQAGEIIITRQEQRRDFWSLTLIFGCHISAAASWKHFSMIFRFVFAFQLRVIHVCMYYCVFCLPCPCSSTHCPSKPVKLIRGFCCRGQLKNLWCATSFFFFVVSFCIKIWKFFTMEKSHKLLRAMRRKKCEKRSRLTKRNGNTWNIFRLNGKSLAFVENWQLTAFISGLEMCANNNEFFVCKLKITATHRSPRARTKKNQHT